MFKKLTLKHFKLLILLVLVTILVHALISAQGNFVPTMTLDQSQKLESYAGKEVEIRFFRSYDGNLEKIGVHKVGTITLSYKDNKLVHHSTSNSSVLTVLVDSQSDIKRDIAMRFSKNSSVYRINEKFLDRLVTTLKNLKE